MSLMYISLLVAKCAELSEDDFFGYLQFATIHITAVYGRKNCSKFLDRLSTATSLLYIGKKSLSIVSGSTAVVDI